MSRTELFDTAVNKALTYTLRLGVPLDDPDKLTSGLELWYLKTRFAYRVPFDDVLEVLSRCPDSNHRWTGGQSGHWVAEIIER